MPCNWNNRAPTRNIPPVFNRSGAILTGFVKTKLGINSFHDIRPRAKQPILRRVAEGERVEIESEVKDFNPDYEATEEREDAGS